MNDNLFTTDDMISDLGVSDVEAEQLRGLLREVSQLADTAPEPSADVRAMLDGAVPLRARRSPARSRVLVAAAVGAVALGGVSAAAAANRLPAPIQDVVADVTAPLPVQAPRPVKPVDPPHDAPGHIMNPPKAPTADDDSPTPKPLNSTAPGQIQKLTKPDPTAPGPAAPADPGSHGRLHNETNVNDDDDETDDPGDDAAEAGKLQAEKVEAERVEADNDDQGDNDDDDGGAGSANKGKGKGNSD